jgi:hypothetical protein
MYLAKDESQAIQGGVDAVDGQISTPAPPELRPTLPLTAACEYFVSS